MVALLLLVVPVTSGCRPAWSGCALERRNDTVRLYCNGRPAFPWLLPSGDAVSAAANLGPTPPDSDGLSPKLAER